MCRFLRLEAVLLVDIRRDWMLEWFGGDPEGEQAQMEEIGWTSKAIKLEAAEVTALHDVLLDTPQADLQPHARALVARLDATKTYGKRPRKVKAHFTE